MKGLGTVSKSTVKAIAKVPLLGKAPVDKTLIKTGDKLKRMEKQRSARQLRKLADQQSGCVRPFIDNIETVDRLYNNEISMVFDKETIYLGVTE